MPGRRFDQTPALVVVAEVLAGLAFGLLLFAIGNDIRETPDQLAEF